MTEHYPLPERKLIYRILHKQLADHPDLMDCSMLDDLQTGLQRAAQAEGVDIGDHGQWDEWLGNAAVACAVRGAGRKVFR